ncbi:hypothetical protein FSP39_013270 [Pinctada imbricata]|uniref:Large ribosomal subunit protein eL14 n=1 Tax=Pinctada imbricata TaxID=66713 RepID=A0AA89BLZ7_PINIB|nr:hypothetical protein FSP39_013270 [Pinctada imbricata]
MSICGKGIALFERNLNAFHRWTEELSPKNLQNRPETFNFVEVGRVAMIAYGKDKGKLCVIMDIIDQNRALVDGPATGVKRQAVNFKTMHLTGLKMDIPRAIRTATLLKAWQKENMSEQWEKTSWAKKIANREKRANLSDFDRFKLMKAKQARNRLIDVEFGKLRKQWKKVPVKPKKSKKRKTAKK